MGVSGPNDKELKPRITVIGVGGAGCNAVNNMITSGLEGVEFIVCNTDAQALSQSSSEVKIQLGLKITQGLGAGSSPEMGKAAAEETLEEVMSYLKGTNMLFVTAGMGGGTGTGGAPVIAKAAREMGILTVGVVTKPFHFEGNHRMIAAEKGIEEMHQCVDTLLVIPNQNLFRVATENTTFAEAFGMADDILHSGVRTFTDLMIKHGLINLDFADISAVMKQMIGKAMMGTGQASAGRRAIEAAEAAISCPLLDDVSMRGARAVLINITGGLDMTLFEVDEAANRIREEVDPNANIIFGATFDEKMSGQIRVSVVATGIDVREPVPQAKEPAFTSSTTSVLRSTLFAQKSSTFFEETREDDSKVELFDEEPDLFERAQQAQETPQAAPPAPESSFSDQTWGRKHDLFSFEYAQKGSTKADLKEMESPFQVGNSIQKKKSLEEEYLSPEKGEAPPAKPLNFFERLAGAARRTSSSVEPLRAPPERKELFTTFESQESALSFDEESLGLGLTEGSSEKNFSGLEADGLDIPAFLRYQKRKR